jgi:hypothetical protein
MMIEQQGMSCVIIMNVVSAMVRRKKESKCDREPVTSFAVTLVAYETAKSFGYMHGYLQITLGKKVICMQILM